MAVVKEFSNQYCKKVRITNKAHANLSEEEINQRNQQIQIHANMLAKTLIEQQRNNAS